MCPIGSVLEGGPKIEIYIIVMGVENRGTAVKVDKNTNKLVIMHVRISQKVGGLTL